MQAGKDISKPSAAIASFHEMKFAVVARLFEGQSPEFQSHRRINPWNSNRCRVCEVFACSMNYTHKLRFTVKNLNSWILEVYFYLHQSTWTFRPQYG